MPKYIHKSFVHCLHVHEVSVPIPCFVNANISKPVLVTAYTVSAISDVTMQSVNVTSVPICRSDSKNQYKTFEIPVNVIRSNVHKTVVSYKTAIVLFWCCCTECKCYFFTYY